MSWANYFKDTVRSKFKQDFKVDMTATQLHSISDITEKNIKKPKAECLIMHEDFGKRGKDQQGKASKKALINTGCSPRDQLSSEASYRLKRKNKDFSDYAKSIVDFCKILKKESESSARSILNLVQENSHLLDNSLKEEICRRLRLLEEMTSEFDGGLVDIENHLAQMVLEQHDAMLENTRLQLQIKLLIAEDYWGLVDAYEDRIRSLELQIGKDNEANLKQCLDRIEILIQEGAETEFEAGVVKLAELKKEFERQKAKQVRSYVMESDSARDRRLLQSYSFVNKRLQDKLLALLRYDHSRDAILEELKKMVRSLQKQPALETSKPTDK